MISLKSINSRILRYKEWKLMRRWARRLSRTTQLTNHDQSSGYPGSTGSKKDTSEALPKKYSAEFVERCWNDWWWSQGYCSPHYKREGPSSGREFVMILPPPNVTGTLHLGHALGDCIQDAFARWHRMHGDRVLWIPGSDHAGIATQVVVEKQLQRLHGVTRHHIGRDQFIKHVWQWKNEKGGAIYEQMKELGLSLDWEHESFTLDPKLSSAVREAFIRLHDEGLIYRSKRLVNWCCALKSAISDIEVDSMDVAGKMYLSVPGYDDKVPFGVLTTVSYPIHNSNTGEYIAVATTRPETILGDVAIAIHPDDPRYTHLHGNQVLHPLTGRTIPIVCDEFVNRGFGTGAVKITPGHDLRDYDVGTKHNLPMLNIMTEEGTLTNVPEEFQGLPRFTAREKVIAVLCDKQLLVDVRDHAMVLPVCSRTGDVIEHMLKDQWFVDCSHMAHHATQAVRSGELKLVPSHYESQWYDWLDNIREWCISRQLWWGHQIPAYRATNIQSGEELGWVAAHSETEARNKACQQFSVSDRHISLQQDSDVLDTWFSSALLPFSVLGWPQQTEDLASFYPTSLLVTASDIMFFWVARMVMMAHTLTAKLPFNTVLFHSVLRDSSGRKMSKSLGNIIDPIDIINGISLQDLHTKLDGSYLSNEEITRAKLTQTRDYPDGIPPCGVDALRYTLCSYNYKANYINVIVDHVVENRHFCNKLWQSYRFITSTFPTDFTPQDIQSLSLSATDRWLLSRLSTVVHDCHEHFSNYDLHKVTVLLKSFWWNDLCDLYLEYVKGVIRSGSGDHQVAARQLLYHTVWTYLRCVAPFMPYLCEELYQRLPGVPAHSICVASYPRPEQFPWRDESADYEMKVVRTAINDVRSLTQNTPKFQLYIQCSNDQLVPVFKQHNIVLEKLSRASHVTITDQSPAGCVPHYNEGYTLHIKAEESLNTNQELSKIEVQMAKLEKSMEMLSKKTDTRSGVPQHIAAAAQLKIDAINEKLVKLEERHRKLCDNSPS